MKEGWQCCGSWVTGEICSPMKTGERPIPLRLAGNLVIIITNTMCQLTCRYAIASFQIVLKIISLLLEMFMELALCVKHCVHQWTGQSRGERDPRSADT